MFIRKAQSERALTEQRHAFEQQLAACRDELNAIRQHLACIEFSADGVILDANARFLALTGYALDEIRGQHHRMFCEPAYTASHEYATFWRDLAQGQPRQATFRRLSKSRQTIWLEASYFPVRNASGQVVKIIKIATDVTANHFALLDKTAMFTALNHSLAVIEFKPDGTILNANSNFLSLMGYTLAEVRGQHHRLFCEPGQSSSHEYSEFWRRLAAGEFVREQARAGIPHDGGDRRRLACDLCLATERLQLAPQFAREIAGEARLDECIDDRPDGIGFACRAHAQDLEPLGRAVLALLACMAGQQPADVGLDNGQLVIDLPALLHGQGDVTRRLSDTALVKLFRLLRLARRLLDLEAGAADSGT